jgi:diadenosine tetraphosphate (Ap4A) HIT family hydrolase
MTFELHPNFASKTFITDLPLSRVFLEDEKNYPWIFLIPRRPTIAKIMDLSLEDQIQLVKELDVAQKIIWEQFKPTQINVAALGNKTPQLHVHVIARYNYDPAWPATVWDHPVRLKYTPEEKENMTKLLKDKFDKQISSGTL